MAVEIERNGDVWTVINNRPEARNAGDPETVDALVGAFQAFEDSDAKVAVFWGAGGAFCVDARTNVPHRTYESDRALIYCNLTPISLRVPALALTPASMVWSLHLKCSAGVMAMAEKKPE